MFGRIGAAAQELSSKLAAIGKSQALIEFDLDGKILDANDNFLKAMGYSLDEIKGKHHSMFVSPDYAKSAEYRDFWSNLRAGKFQTAEYLRLGKGGREVWIQASYNPILGTDGKPVKIIKCASDVTERKLRDAELAGQVAAIGRSQAVIEFDMDGTIRNANRNFLDTMGYSIEEIKGRHHSIFVDPAYRESSDYRAFWDKLRRGEYQAAEYKRIGKGGREIWLQATYNPILDGAGRPFKVVKFATDVTARKMEGADIRGQLYAIGKAQAVIEFELDGTIRNANENFLNALGGYRLDEVKGRHHSMFVSAAERESPAYKQFWQNLREGRFQAGEFLRISKSGRDVWIQASYNPILDPDGRPYKVVKFAYDVTPQVQARMRAEKVSSLMDSVAAGAEELNASVREIASSMTKSKDTTTEAFDLVVSADRATKDLTDATRAMGGILEAITGITGQINLLALNATIESARAGEAGKGFAVVANEVKNLASQARNATEQISGSIDSMQSISSDVVGALGAIRQSMQQVLEYVSSTAAAVEEQSAVANDMSSSMQRAAAEAARVG